MKILGQVKGVFVNFDRELIFDPVKNEDTSFKSDSIPNDFREFKAQQRSRESSLVNLDNSKDDMTEENTSSSMITI